MSDSEMPFQPRIDEPSKPRPSSKASSSIADSGSETCCQVPSRSVNLRSTIFAPASRANSSASPASAGGVRAVRQVVLLVRHAAPLAVRWSMKKGPTTGGAMLHPGREASLPPRRPIGARVARTVASAARQRKPGGRVEISSNRRNRDHGHDREQEPGDVRPGGAPRRTAPDGGGGDRLRPLLVHRHRGPPEELRDHAGRARGRARRRDGLRRLVDHRLQRDRGVGHGRDPRPGDVPRSCPTRRARRRSAA